MKKLQLFTLIALLSSATYFNQAFALWPFKSNTVTQTNTFQGNTIQNSYIGANVIQTNILETQDNSVNQTANQANTVNGQVNCYGGDTIIQTITYRNGKMVSTTVNIDGGKLTVNGLNFECDGPVSIINGEVRCNGKIIYPANQTSTNKQEAKIFFRRLFKK